MSVQVQLDRSTALISAPVVISLFGNLRVTVNGKSVDSFRLNKSRALLAYLLIEGAQPLLRSNLATLLWPGYTATSARDSLRQALGDLRTLLEPFDLLQLTRHHVALDTASSRLECDVRQFQTLLSRWQAHAHLSLADCPPCQAHLQEAVALANGGFLDELPDIGSPPFDAWRQAQRRHFAEQVAAAQAALATLQRSGNVRPALTTLIGRTTEMAELTQKIQHPTYRCLTLTGPGGVGKTRLACALGAQMQPVFADGVWLIELAALSQPVTFPAHKPGADPATPGEAWLHDRIATAVANALGLKFHAHGRPSVQVATYLRDKNTLLILDNFEHLEAGVDWLLTLLETAPRLRLVITSRHRLPLHAQIVYAIEGLPVPPLANTAPYPNATIFTDYASVQLFIERATNAQIPLTLDHATLTLVSQICWQVAGHPLAIELAVAMLARQSPAELFRAIRGNYRALREGWRDLPPRHRSAEAVLRSAWGLLTPDEATLLARCAVFRGGFTGAAVQAIGEMSIDDLQALLHKSLVHPAGATRFTLHELVRQFAAEQLAQTGEEERIQARHAAYYIDLAQARENALLRDFAAQEALHHELDNLRTAWQWSATNGDLALLTTGAPSLFTFYRLTGLYHEAIQHLESASAGVRLRHDATPAAPAPLRLLARLSCYAADFYRRTGALAASAKVAEEALALGQQLADPAIQAAALHELARLAQVRGEFLTMQILAEEGCTQARQTSNGGVLVECLNAVGWALSSQQKPLAAIPYFQAALAALAAAPNYHLEGRIRANLGRSYLATRAYVLAQRHFEDALAVQQRLRDQEEILLTRFMLGELWTTIGDYTAAQQAFAQANALIQLTANPYWLCWLQLRYGHWQQRCGDFTGAQVTLSLARQTAQQSENKVFEGATLIALGLLFIEQEQWDAARQCYEKRLALQTGSTHAADIQAGLAICALIAGQPVAAVTYVDAALALLARHGAAATYELYQIYWLCLRVLQTTADPRALDLLRTASALLHQDAAQFSDDAQRRRFLDAVGVHRAIHAAAQAAGLA